METETKELAPVLIKIAEENIYILFLMVIAYFVYKIYLKKLELNKVNEDFLERLETLENSFEEVKNKSELSSAKIDELKFKFTFLKSEIDD
jgi:Tfp pilus assembly protein PilE